MCLLFFLQDHVVRTPYGGTGIGGTPSSAYPCQYTSIPVAANARRSQLYAVFTHSNSFFGLIPSRWEVLRISRLARCLLAGSALAFPRSSSSSAKADSPSSAHERSSPLSSSSSRASGGVASFSSTASSKPSLDSLLQLPLRRRSRDTMALPLAGNAFIALKRANLLWAIPATAIDCHFT